MIENKKYPKYIYLIGAGGIGMSALGLFFISEGSFVAGYDKTPGANTDTLKNKGIEIIFEDSINLIPQCFINNISDSLIIYTPAIPSDSEILNWFINNSFKIYKRAEILGLISEKQETISIAGTHGKTTTSSMVTHILRESNIDVTAFIGGISTNLGTNFIKGNSGVLVAEADEYDRSFLQLSTNYAVITSIEPDHLDIYGTYEELIKSFKKFAEKVDPKGNILVNKKYVALIEHTHPGIIAYDSIEDSPFCAKNINPNSKGINFTIKFPTKSISLNMPIYGIHNVENAIAAAGVCFCYGIQPEAITKALSSFKGVKRRFDIIAERGGKVIIDDYAHHPDEIRALANTIKLHFPTKKTMAIFQPHLYTRTRDFKNEFVESLSMFNCVMLMDIYPAREKPIPGITSNMLIEKINCEEKGIISKDDFLNIPNAKNYDIIVTIGAGDIENNINDLKQWLFSNYEN